MADSAYSARYITRAAIFLVISKPDFSYIFFKTQLSSFELLGESVPPWIFTQLSQGSQPHAPYRCLPNTPASHLRRLSGSDVFQGAYTSRESSEVGNSRLPTLIPHRP